MTLAYDVELAAELLDASRGMLDQDEFDRRRQLLDQARAPRVAFMRRMSLIDEAVKDLS